MPDNNPLLAATPVPLLDQIKPEHFAPAIDALVDDATARLEALKANEDATGFETLAEPMEALFADIFRLGNLTTVFKLNVITPGMDEAAAYIAQKSDAFSKAVFQDSDLAKKFHDLYEQGLPEDPVKKRLMQFLHRKFLEQGAFLDAAGQARLRDLDQELIAQCELFDKQVKGAQHQHAVHITDPADLSGIDADTVQSLAENAAENGLGGWLVTIERVQIDRYMKIADSRDLRRRLLEAVDALGTVAPNDNGPVLENILKLRHERAQLLGYEHYAAYALDGTMAGTLEKAEQQIHSFAAKAFDLFEEEMALVETYARENGGPANLQPWDTSYWAGRYMNAHFSYDDRAFAEYLKLDDTLDGFFRHCGRLFNLSFHANDQHPVFHTDLKAYDVFDDAAQKAVGVLYVDAYSRPKLKRGGGWMEHLQNGGPGKANCVMMSVSHAKGEHTILAPDDAQTLFHEGGHALHGLLGASMPYVLLQGTNSTVDYTEIPSTIQEYWVNNAACLGDFARHYKTGEKVPQALLDARKRSESFFLSWDKLRILQNALYDFTFHKTAPEDYKGVADVIARATFNHKGAPHLRPYPLTRFYHLFTEAQSKYAAGYYGYFWSALHAAHGFSLFERSNQGIYDPQLGAKLKAMYSKGAAASQSDAYNAFAGGPATPEALLTEIGLPPQAAARPARPITHP